MKRRIPLFSVMAGVSLALHGAAFLLLPGFHRSPARLSKPAETGVFSLISIELPAAVPKPPPPARPATAPLPALPPAVQSAAGVLPPEEAVPADMPAEAPVPAVEGPAAAEVSPPRGGAVPRNLRAETAAPAAGGAAQNAAGSALSAAEKKAPVAAYTRRSFDHIRRRIMEKLVYPPQARRTGAQGKAEAVFTVYPDGSVGDVKILVSSGQDILDQALADAIRAAAPFPPPPVKARLVMPLAFRLK
ncbi:MAG: TonB family protein [Treponema sp.]|jgi:protein TonB|nr:TonB family protein [Treponema sp.]